MKILVIFTVVMFASFNAYAQSAKNAWTQCGIGAMVFDETPWAALTSNLTWDLGITGSTSSSSSPSQCSGKVADAGRFIHKNYDNLEQETANGQGEHIAAVLQILGCDKESHSLIINDIRTKLHNELKTNKDQSLKARNYFYNLSDTIELKYSQQCSAV